MKDNKIVESAYDIDIHSAYTGRANPCPGAVIASLSTALKEGSMEFSWLNTDIAIGSANRIPKIAVIVSDDSPVPNGAYMLFHARPNTVLWNLIKGAKCGDEVLRDIYKGPNRSEVYITKMSHRELCKQWNSV